MRAVLGMTIGFLNNPAWINIFTYSMEACVVGVGIGVLGLVSAVICNECFYADDACCIKIEHEPLLEPEQLVQNTTITVYGPLAAQHEKIESSNNTKRFCCCI